MDHIRYLYRGNHGRLMKRDFFVDIASIMEHGDFITIRSQCESDRIFNANGSPSYITFVISQKLKYDRRRWMNDDANFLDDRQNYGFSRIAFWDGNDEFCEFFGLRNDVIQHIADVTSENFLYIENDSGNDGRYVGRDIFYNENIYPTINGEAIGFFMCEDEEYPVLGNENGFSYCRDDGRYRYDSNIPSIDDEESDDEESITEVYVSPYHDGRSEYIRDSRAENNGFYIGFEIEKEDEDVRNSISISEFKAAFPHWRKERDGSLSGSSGYELISPILPLDIDFIREMFRYSPILTRHINADFSAKCGGHINISDENRPADILFDDIAGYFPILAALYPSRCNNDFSKLYGKIKMKGGIGGRSAFYLRSDRIELRIFPAVRNVENLIFRANLILYMMRNPARYLSDVNMEDIGIICSMIHNTEGKRSAFIDRIEKFDSIIFEPTT